MIYILRTLLGAIMMIASAGLIFALCYVAKYYPFALLAIVAFIFAYCLGHATIDKRY